MIVVNAASARRFGLQFNAVFEKYMFLIIPASLMLGFLFSVRLHGLTGWVPYLFAYLTFVMAMGCSRQQIRDAFRMPLVMLMLLLIAHVVAPLVAFGLGTLFFGAGSPFVIGMVLFAVIPLGVSSVIWVGLSGGSVPLALSLIVVDSALSPLVVPAEISFFFGTQVDFDLWKLMGDLAVIIVIPTVLGVAVNEWSKGKAKPYTAPVAAPTSKLCFVAVVGINAAAIAPYVAELKSDFALLLPAVVLLVALCYLMGFGGALAFRRPDLTVTLLYASGMRNISLGLVLGLSYFEPKAAVPVVLSILIQQPMANVMHVLLGRFLKKDQPDSVGKAA